MATSSSSRIPAGVERVTSRPIRRAFAHVLRGGPGDVVAWDRRQLGAAGTPASSAAGRCAARQYRQALRLRDPHDDELLRREGQRSPRRIDLREGERHEVSRARPARLQATGAAPKPSRLGDRAGGPRWGRRHDRGAEGDSSPSPYQPRVRPGKGRNTLVRFTRGRARGRQQVRRGTTTRQLVPGGGRRDGLTATFDAIRAPCRSRKGARRRAGMKATSLRRRNRSGRETSCTHPAVADHDPNGKPAGMKARRK